MCVSKNISLLVQREKKVNISKRISSLRDLYFFQEIFIYFVLTYVYVSCLLLSPENICRTRSCEWGTPWDSNSLGFVSRMFFRFCMGLYRGHKPIQNLKRLSTNTSGFVSLITPFTCTTCVLWRKQQDGNIHVCKNEMNK